MRQVQQPLNPVTQSLVTCHNLDHPDHPRSITRRIKACLTLAGAAAAAVLALAGNQSRG
ncbi:MAG: hypothetical protein QOD02_6023 [Mycobacterium sp.]|jgi:hypothetical protein|nr:hypothetical protein [Mycobacterium sp.]